MITYTHNTDTTPEISGQLNLGARDCVDVAVWRNGNGSTSAMIFSAEESELARPIVPIIAKRYGYSGHGIAALLVRDALDQKAREFAEAEKKWREAPMLDRVVVRSKATGHAASVTADELAQLKIELEHAGGRLYPVAGLGPNRYVLNLPDPTGAGKGGSIEVVLDSDSSPKAIVELEAAVKRAIGKIRVKPLDRLTIRVDTSEALAELEAAAQGAAKAAANAGAAVERASEALKSSPATADIAGHLTMATDFLKAGEVPRAAACILAAATLAELGRLHFVEVGDASMGEGWASTAERLRDLADSCR